MAGALEINMEFPIDKYDRMEILGYGAYGTIYLYKQRLPAKELVLPNFIAVKTFGSEHYFQIEKKNLDMISSKGQEHPNLVKIYGWCKLPNYIFGIVMERLLRGALRSVLRRHMGRLMGKLPGWLLV